MSEGIPEGWTVNFLADAAANVNAKYLPNAADYFRYVGLEHIVPESHSLTNWGSSRDVVSTKSVFAEGDTLFGKLRPYLKKVSYANFGGVCSTDILVVRAKDQIHPPFLFRVLSSEASIAHSMESSAGNVMPRTSWKDMADFQFLFPPLPEQKKIASILTSVDEVIEKTEAQIRKLQDLKKGMIQELLTKGIGHTEFKDSSVGRIPKEWELHAMGKLFSIQLGKMLNKKARDGESPFHYLANRNVQWGQVRLDSLPMMHFDERERKKYELKNGDLLICEGGEVGRAAIWNNELINCYYQKAIHRVRPKNDDCVTRYYLYFMEYIVKSNLLTNFVSQTSIAHLTKENLEVIPVPLPKKAEQEEIATIIQSIMNLIRSQEIKHESFIRLKNALMQDLLTGKVRVKVN